MAKTSISAGSIIYDILTGNAGVMERTTKVFPVVTDSAQLPYIAYRRSKLEHEPTKAGYPGADTVQMEVWCYTANYADGVELAEAVREALDYAQYNKDGLKMRGCILTGSEEAWEDDAYIQKLVFNLKI